MKKTLFAILSSTILGATALIAEDVTTTTTTATMSTGTISAYTPGTVFTVKETSGPVTYRYGKTVTYVNKAGTTLTDDEVRTRIKVGVPVSVSYSTEGDARVINRVVVEED